MPGCRTRGPGKRKEFYRFLIYGLPGKRAEEIIERLEVFKAYDPLDMDVRHLFFGFGVNTFRDVQNLPIPAEPSTVGSFLAMGADKIQKGFGCFM